MSPEKIGLNISLIKRSEKVFFLTGTDIEQNKFNDAKERAEKERLTNNPNIKNSMFKISIDNLSNIQDIEFATFTAVQNQSVVLDINNDMHFNCLLYTSPSPRDKRQSRMPSSA